MIERGACAGTGLLHVLQMTTTAWHPSFRPVFFRAISVIDSLSTESTARKLLANFLERFGVYKN
jgi:hypothetical protein